MSIFMKWKRRSRLHEPRFFSGVRAAVALVCGPWTSPLLPFSAPHTRLSNSDSMHGPIHWASTSLRCNDWDNSGVGHCEADSRRMLRPRDPIFDAKKRRNTRHAKTRRDFAIPCEKGVVQFYEVKCMSTMRAGGTPEGVHVYTCKWRVFPKDPICSTTPVVYYTGDIDVRTSRSVHPSLSRWEREATPARNRNPACTKPQPGVQLNRCPP